MAFTESAADFINTSDFAITATVGGGSVNGIFDNDYFEVPAGTPGGESAQPSLLCASADVASAVHGTVVVISGTTYHVVNVQPDGLLFTRLILEKQ